MSTSDHLLLFLHIGFAIFTLGPLTAATMSTPRYIRRRNVVVLRYLHRVTQIYGVTSLGIFLFGLLLAQGDLAEVWLSASMTLFIVALVLLLIVERDQRKAAHLLEVAAEKEGAAPAGPAPEDEKGAGKDTGDAARPGSGDDIAQVERGRIAAISGVVALMWLVILLLMVWNG
ncbi:hypothetical protein [Actinomadura livida]|uniref:Putative membrane protein n=1 Tax=Actinomadura livida TaxID=79909 RepID=A0A7W7MWU8_9ACTN|nr:MULTISPECIES: hypothetical protein [Actinomadura]MBB4773224.1 putative membrane protein [Actinomadura catellatispora]GGU18912.1 hypothetical protein GCM10010208_50130 [Actinomadura livida]